MKKPKKTLLLFINSENMVAPSRYDVHGDELKFNIKLIFDIHKYFLNTLYSWAGKIRSVNISKNNILFAPANHIKKALTDFEIILNKNLPKINENKKQLQINCQ